MDRLGSARAVTQLRSDKDTCMPTVSERHSLYRCLLKRIPHQKEESLLSTSAQRSWNRKLTEEATRRVKVDLELK